MTETEKRVPELRFEGFVEDWEQRKLISEIDKVLDYRGKSPTKFGMKWESTGYLVLSALNVKDGYIDKAVDAMCGNQALFERWMGFERLEKGDVILTTEAPLGNVAQIPDDDGYILNQRAVGFKTNPDNLNNNFLAQLLRSPLFQNVLQANASGGTAKGIGMKEFAKIDVMIPLEIVEQKKIGNFFNLIDDTIALHQRKLTLLEQLKKEYLTRMFPQNGENIPNLRFADFSEPWDQRKLGDLGSFKNGMNFDKSAMGHGHPFINLQNIFGKTIVDGTGLGLAVSSEKQRNEYNLLKGDVLFIRSSVKPEGVGEAALVPTNFDNTTFSGFIIRFRPHVAIDNEFKRVIFATKNVRNQIMALATSSANTNINQDSLEMIIIELPRLSEQSKIGNLFKRLDDALYLHQSKIEKLTELKKVLLANMFL